MKYYDKNGHEFEYTLSKSIGNGRQGNVSLVNEDDSICLKRYYIDLNNKDEFCDLNTCYDPYIFEYLKSYDSGFSQLHDLLYDENIKKIIGYTAKYYSNIFTDLFSMPIEYLLDNFNILYNLMEKIAHDMVRVVDFHSENILLTSDGMKIIDMDKYQFDKDNKYEVILDINRMALYYTFKGIFIKELVKRKMNTKENISIINNLFYYGTTPYSLKIKTRGIRKFNELLR